VPSRPEQANIQPSSQGEDDRQPETFFWRHRDVPLTVLSKNSLNGKPPRDVMAQMVAKDPVKGRSLRSMTNNTLQRTGGGLNEARLSIRPVYVPSIKTLECKYKIARRYCLVQYLEILSSVETLEFVKVS
jgi:hypothetical protein